MEVFLGADSNEMLPLSHQGIEGSPVLDDERPEKAVGGVVEVDVFFQRPGNDISN